RLTLQATLTPAEDRRKDFACVIGFATNERSYNFILGRNGDWLVFRLRTSEREFSEWKLQRLTPGYPAHVLVTYRPNELVCHVDGKQVLETDATAGDFLGWRSQHLTFGDLHDGGANWPGRLEGVAVYNRFMNAEEARAEYRNYSERLQIRRELPAVEIDAVLRSVAPVGDLGTSRQALVGCEYEVRRVHEGSCPHPRILVLHWAVLDGRRLDDAQRKLGSSHRMTLERFTSQLQPQLRDAPVFLNDRVKELPRFIPLEK
ncbi:MAG: LamG domain-containing protein, partial [Planctomycetales bacterium]